MDVFLLGAGRPAHGIRPSALIPITLNSRAMDWQIDSFGDVAAADNIHYLGGYHVQQVIEHYPQLNFTVIPDWKQQSVLHTFLKAPFTDSPVVISYSDTVFRKTVITALTSANSDIVVAVDSHWQSRYEQRPESDIRIAETVEVLDDTGVARVTEFTGLTYFNSRAVGLIKVLEESAVGASLINLIEHLEKGGLSVSYIDVKAGWAEFNSPRDIAKFILGTKAETLARLEPLVQKSFIGKQVAFNREQWRANSVEILASIQDRFTGASLIVRSSAIGEDGWQRSNAGGFESLLDVDGSNEKDVSVAINVVFESYQGAEQSSDQVLVQAFLEDVRLAGVVFTCSLETGAPYYRFNFDDKSSSTVSVTAGSQADLRTVIVNRNGREQLMGVAPELLPVLEAVTELERLLGFDRLDIEFAIDNSGQVHIFQVRPIAVDFSDQDVDLIAIEANLEESTSLFVTEQCKSPFIYGEKTVFANMSDWNPAEIIGTRPRPLAFSLYRQLVTDDAWAQQRAEYGYRDVRPQPLVTSFSGHPYIDVRASLNSFIPHSLSEQTAQRLVDGYLNLFIKHPELHDKIEFEIAFTVWTPAFLEAARQRLLAVGVADADIQALESALKVITRKAFLRLADDIGSVNLLADRRVQIELAEIPPLSKALILLDDCKRFGTLAFAHAARAGFVATSWLNGVTARGIFSEQRRSAFLQSLQTVSRDLRDDKKACHEGRISSDTLVSRYGHLRPGTYEITNQAYWEAPEKYLQTDTLEAPVNDRAEFWLTDSESALLNTELSLLGSALSPAELIDYLQTAINSRELIKFEFTKNLSRALDLFVQAGELLGLSRDDISYLETIDLAQLKGNVVSVAQLRERIEIGRRQYRVAQLIELPPVIQTAADMLCFEYSNTLPNFISVDRVVAPIELLGSGVVSVPLAGKLILTRQADPGYDWLFGHRIAGLITQYGGANSHMAIRAAEIGLPAAIGVGEKLYEQISQMSHVELDCGNRVIREVL